MDIHDALKKCKTEIQNNQYEDAQPQCIYEIFKYASSIEDKEYAQQFLLQSIVWLREPANGMYNSNGLRNDILYTACIDSLSLLSTDDLSSFFIEEFKKNMTKDTNYEMMVANGRIALALSRWHSKDAVPVFTKFLSDWSHYEGDDFWMEIQYAVWMIEKDSFGAREYLLNKSEGVSFASAALGDLNAKDSEEDLKIVLAKIKHPVTKLVLLETLNRLKTQNKVPPPEDRMIWLFGLYPESLKGMGLYDEDNFFIGQSNNFYPIEEADRGNIGSDY